MANDGFVDLSEQPTSPPPDKNKPYIWLAGKWYLMAQDSTDGVPDDLSNLDKGGAKGDGKS
jgi:hypothetical protein